MAEDVPRLGEELVSGEAIQAISRRHRGGALGVFLPGGAAVGALEDADIVAEVVHCKQGDGIGWLGGEEAVAASEGDAAALPRGGDVDVAHPGARRKAHVM